MNTPFIHYSCLRGIVNVCHKTCIKRGKEMRIVMDAFSRSLFHALSYCRRWLVFFCAFVYISLHAQMRLHRDTHTHTCTHTHTHTHTHTCTHANATQIIPSFTDHTYTL